MFFWSKWRKRAEAAEARVREMEDDLAARHPYTLIARESKRGRWRCEIHKHASRTRFIGGIGTYWNTADDALTAAQENLRGLYIENIQVKPYTG